MGGVGVSDAGGGVRGEGDKIMGGRIMGNGLPGLRCFLT